MRIRLSKTVPSAVPIFERPITYLLPDPLPLRDGVSVQGVVDGDRQQVGTHGGVCQDLGHVRFEGQVTARVGHHLVKSSYCSTTYTVLYMYCYCTTCKVPSVALVLKYKLPAIF